jgi:O-antigen ligase
VRSEPDAPTLVLPVLGQLQPRQLARSDGVRLLTVFAVLLFLIPSTQVFAPLGQAGTPATIFGLCILLWYLVSWIADRLQPSGGGRLVRIALLLFVLAVLASFVAGMTRQISQPEVLGAESQLLFLAAGGGLTVVAAETITDYGRLEVLLRRLVILGAIIATIGILQFAGIDLTRLIHIPGLTFNAGLSADTARNGFDRPQGTAVQPIEFGVVLAMLLPLALQQAFDPRYGGWLRRWLPAGLIAFCAPLTVSRSGIIGMAVTLLILLPSWSARTQRYAVVVIVLFLGLVHTAVHGLITTFVNLFAGIFNGQDTSVKARTADYAGVSQYIAQRPFFGRGYGTFIPALYRFTDNMYLLATVEIGFVGVVLMFFLFVAGIQTAALGRRRTRDEGQRRIGMALIACMAVALATSGTFDALTFSMFNGLFFLLLGCCGAYCMITTRDMDGAASAGLPGHRRARSRGLGDSDPEASVPAGLGVAGS